MKEQESRHTGHFSLPNFWLEGHGIFGFELFENRYTVLEMPDDTVQTEYMPTESYVRVYHLEI
jgi:hypothetical protein